MTGLVQLQYLLWLNGLHHCLDLCEDLSLEYGTKHCAVESSICGTTRKLAGGIKTMDDVNTYWCIHLIQSFPERKRIINFQICSWLVQIYALPLNSPEPPHPILPVSFLSSVKRMNSLLATNLISAVLLRIPMWEHDSCSNVLDNSANLYNTPEMYSFAETQ